MSQRPLTSFGLFSCLMICSSFSGLMYSHYVSDASLFAYAAAQVIVTAAELLLSFILFGKHRKPYTEPKAVLPFAALSGTALLLYFSSVFLTELALFLSTFTHLGARFFLYIAALLVLCVFSARKGIAVLCRCAVLFFLTAGILDIFGVSMLSFRFDPDNFSTSSLLLSDIIEALPYSMIQLVPLPIFSLFRDKLPVRVRTALLWWSILSGVFTIGTALLSCGALGAYEGFVRFPIYAASQTIGAGAFQRLDIVFLCARAIGIFLLLSLLICALGRLWNGCNDRISACFAALSGLVCFFAMISHRFCEILLDRRVMTAAVILSVFVIPLSFAIKPGKSVRRAVSAVTAFCIILTSLTSCGRVQIQDRMMIKGIGIDERNGELLLTVQYIDNYSDGDKQENRVLCVSGKTVSEAVGRIRDSSGSEPFLGQNTAIVFGRDTADGDRIGALLDYFIRYSESRPTVRLYISTSSASDILNFSQNGGIVPIDHITGISPCSSRNDNRFTVLSMADQLSDKTDTPTAAALSISANAIRLGSAAYLTENGAEFLSADDYLVFCLLLGIDSETVLTVSGITCEITKSSPKIKSIYSDGKLSFDIEESVQMTVLENHSGISSYDAQTAFENELKRLSYNGVYNMINKNGCDIYGLGRKLSRDERSCIQDKAEYGRLLRSAELSVAVRCRIVEAKALS